MSFKVSVVIPVYNAAKYVRRAVESAECLPEVGEIVLVEDRSPDNALEICKQLVLEYTKVRLYQHPNGENRGAGASRNLGVEKSTHPYVAFLDADDWYLPNRFRRASWLFLSNVDVDGVYEAVGFVRGENMKPHKLYTIQKPVEYQQLFYYLLRGKYGHFHTNAITLKKGLLEITGLFNTSLRLHQDSDLWLKLAYHGRLVAGEIFEPVALVRMHSANRITSANNTSKLQYWLSVDKYFKDKRMSIVNRFLIKRKLLKLRFGNAVGTIAIPFARLSGMKRRPK